MQPASSLQSSSCGVSFQSVRNASQEMVIPVLRRERENNLYKIFSLPSIANLHS